jgi:hypothetical protein
VAAAPTIDVKRRGHGLRYPARHGATRLA